MYDKSYFKPILVENVLDKKTRDEFEDLLTEQHWTYVNHRTLLVARSEDSLTNLKEFINPYEFNIQPIFQFVCSEENPIYSYFLKIVNEVALKIKFSVSKVIRARTVFSFLLNLESSDLVHTDYDYPHLVVLYYVNDADGDTLIYGKDEKTILYRFKPIKNGCLVFDGRYFHSSSSSTKNLRIVSNINLLGKFLNSNICYNENMIYE